MFENDTQYVIYTSKGCCIVSYGLLLFGLGSTGNMLNTQVEIKRVMRGILIIITIASTEVGLVLKN